MARNFMLMTEALKSGSTTALAATTTSPNLGAMAPEVGPPQFNSLIVVVAYVASLLVIVAVLHRCYAHAHHFTPPFRQAYEELVAARGFVQQGAIEFDNNTRQFRPLQPIVQGQGPGSGGEGTSGGSGGGTSAREEGAQFSSEVLARLEQDLRATSFRERERLAAAMNAADLVRTRSLILFPMGSNSSRMTSLRPEFGRLDSLHRATQSARFARVIVSPLPSSSAAAAVGSSNGQLPIRTRSLSFHAPIHNRSLSFQAPIHTRSLSFQALAGPSGFDLSNFNWASQSPPIPAGLGIHSTSLSTTSSTSAGFSQGVVITASPSTSDEAARADPHGRKTSRASVPVRLYNPRKNSEQR